jgi:pilus assembly protein Flp/PilA
LLEDNPGQNADCQEIMLMSQHFYSFLRDESGATAIEYGLIAALVSVATIAALTSMGNSLKTMFGSVSNTLANAAGSG